MISIRDLFNDKSLPELMLDDIMDDSRIKTQNSIFFSRQSLTHDGHSFISQAIDNGAICIVHSRELKHKKEGIVYVYDPDLNENYADYVNRFYDNPSSKLKLIGITGTSGKTTIVTIIQYLMESFKRSGSIGNAGYYFNGHKITTEFTSPSLVFNQKTLRQFVDEGIEICSMEASSQAIDSGRIDGIRFDNAIFTNLSQDHLNYHLNMESYYQAKKKLFSKIDYTKTVIINIDDEYGLRLSKEIVNPVISVSIKDENAHAFIHSIDCRIDKTSFKLDYDNETYDLETNLLGQFNLVNLVQAMMACVIQGLRINDLTELIKKIPSIEGRLQRVKTDEPFDIIIDDAHSPDSMEKVLQFVDSLIEDKGRIIVVFGPTGQSDKSKRLLMGEIADKYCDLIYLTQDDSRKEKSDLSMEIAKGIFDNPYVIINSRQQAIHFAIQSAIKGDIIVLMGWGQQKVNEDVPVISDYAATMEALIELRKEKNGEY